MKKKYKNTHCEAIHETVSGLHKIGLFTDEEMRHFDDTCLVKPAAPVPRVSTQKPQSRMRSGAPVYARGK